MAAPRGSYTPTRGPLAGQTFAMQPGDRPTSPYNRYQQARAVAQGFSSYGGEKRAIIDPMFRALESRMRSVGNMTQGNARSSVRQFMATQSGSASGGRKHNAIKWGMDQGLWDSGDDAADDVPY